MSSRLLSKNVKIRIYKTIILPVLLYGCETWSLTLREEHTHTVFENRVLMRIFGPKGNEVIGGWRKLRNEELHNLYGSSSIIRMMKSRRMRLARHVASMGRRGIYIYMYRSFVGRPQGKRPLGRPRRRWRIILGWILYGMR
jgi:hypothetical protein